jgi:putative two-component system response regulator
MAEDGPSAIRLLATQRCDLVLSEVAMTEMDGYQLCQAIKLAPATAEIPVVLFNAGADDLVRERALQAGADDLLIKPVENSMVLALVKAQLKIRRLRDSLEEIESVVVSLTGGLDDRDRSGTRHSERVAHWAMQLGAALGLPEDQLDLLYRAALLQNVGNLAVPRDILEKSGPLDPAEVREVRRHPEVGEQLLASLPAASTLQPAVRHHHERVDGTGYPDGLRGDAIPLFARVIAIADAFVAMTNQRSYRGRLQHDEAVKILEEGAGKQWDAKLVKRFLGLLSQSEATSIQERRSAG